MTQKRYYVRANVNGEWIDAVRDGKRNFESQEEAESLLESAQEKNIQATLFIVEGDSKPQVVRSVRPGVEL